MKKSTLLVGLVIASVAANAAEISKLVVRQNWPWTPDVRVDFTLTGVSEPTDVAVKCYRGETELAVPAQAITGPRFSLTEGGIYTIVLDAKLILPGVTAVDNFKVCLEASASPENMKDVIYRDFDIERKTVKDITRAALLNGEYGAVETSFSAIDPAFSTSLSDVLIWTGVTNDIKWATKHIVMRKIPAKAMSPWTMCPKSDSGFNASKHKEHAVTFTHDYWMSVFEMTEEQFRLVMGYANGNQPYTNAAFRAVRPVVGRSYNHFRGSTIGHGWPNADLSVAYAVDSGTIADNLRSKFEGYRFDMPTEAQWECAARAGTATLFYSGSNANTNDERYKLGRSAGNGGFDTTNNCEYPGDVGAEYGLAPVGLYKPNAFGLYDMLGNAYEWCLDQSTDAASDFADDDTVDPHGISANSRYRQCRGGSYNHQFAAPTCSQRYSFHDNGSSAARPDGGRGFRLCITED